jgi:phosphate acetyltransferase
MRHTIFIAPTEIKTGLTSITLGLMRALDQLGLKVAVCKPIAKIQKGTRQRSVDLLEYATGIEPPQPISLKHAQSMMSDGKQDRLMEEVIAMHRGLKNEADVVLIEGIEPDRNEPYAAKLNTEMAKTLDADVILVVSPKGRNAAALHEHLEVVKSLYGGEKNQNLLGCILNKVNAPKDPSLPIKSNDPSEADQHSAESNKAQFSALETNNFKIIGTVPWSATLVAPRLQDIASYLQADYLSENSLRNTRVKRITFCARTMPNMVASLQPGTLIITPGDRADIILATAVAASNGVPLAGLLLTSNLIPDTGVMNLLKPSLSTLPILTVESDTFEVATQLAHMNDAVTADDSERVENIMNHMASNIDSEFLKKRIKIDKKIRLSPAAFRYQLVQQAKSANKSVVLPEGEEPRTIEAAVICQQRGIANCILLGDRERIEHTALSLGIKLPDDLQILNPEEIRQRYVDPMVELRKHKQLSAPMALAQLEDTVVLGTMMLALDEVDGLVSGAIHTTANTIRPALQLIKTAEGAKLVSSIFFMLLPEQVMVYGDCAVNPDPNAEELCDIALQSATSAKSFGIEPKVAMISYSTGSSGSGSDVVKVREATELAKKADPSLIIDGPLQYDAATTASVAKSKAPNSPVAGQASVVIFPDLNTGNTTYKAVQRSANVVSIGPMLQGLAKPVNDLSRGALVEDIVYTIALTAIQAIK